MAIDLINIDNIVLVNDFETWLERTNEIIDALNPLQIYDLDDTGANIQNPLFVAGTVPVGFSLGLQFYRDIRFDGDMLIEVHADPPLGFDPTTGALQLSFTGPFAPPLLTGTPCGGVNAIANGDLFLVEDISASTTKMVAAENMLPPRILCDHTFGDGVTDVTITIEGDLVVNGTQTILNTTTVESTDPIIDLNSDGTGTATPAGNDALLGAGGIRILSTDGNKNFLWEVADNRWHISSTDLGDRGFQIDDALSLFTRTIEPLTNNLDIVGSGTGEAVSVHWHEAGEDDHWRFMLREFSTGQVAYTLGTYPVGGDSLNDNGVFVLQHSTANDAGPVFDIEIFFDSVTPTRDALIFGFARNLNADLLDGCHASETPTAFFIPCASASGFLDPGWLLNTGNIRKDISQTGHGLVKGNVVRVNVSGDYVLAQANTETNAEAVGIVSDVVDLDNFELTLLGCISNLDGVASHVIDHSAGAGAGGPFVPGQAYFLSVNEAGAFTPADVLGGDVQKTVLIATSTTDAIIMNYVGGKTELSSGTPVVQLTNDVLGSALLGSPIVTSIVERTSRLTANGGTLLLVVQDNEFGTGNRTFDILLDATTTLELQAPALAPSIDPVTNSVTLIIKQGNGGGHAANITIGGGGVIHWDNSVSQPLIQPADTKTTIYVLINVNDVPGIWYGSRAVFQI